MDTTSPADQARAALDREVRLVEGAISAVVSGSSRSLVVAGLSLGGSVLRVVGPEASVAGVRLTPLWNADEDGCDIRVERIDD
jgi:hypothetical protein